MTQTTKKIDYAFKVVLLGDSGVGKTSLIYSYMSRIFKENETPTIGAAYFTKSIDFEGSKIQLEIWDTAGQERFHTIAPVYYRKASGILLVYDITNKKSLDRVKYWISEIMSVGNPLCQIFLIGNKIDLDDKREINEEDIMGLLQKYNIENFEVTAKDPTNIDIIIRELTKRLITQCSSLSKDQGIRLKAEKTKTAKEIKGKHMKCCQGFKNLRLDKNDVHNSRLLMVIMNTKTQSY